MLYIENKSNDGFSKRLYGFPSSAILLDRMNLSARNGWLDEEGRVYIIFTIEEIKGLLVEKKQAYAEYRQVKKEMQEYLIAKQTVAHILGIDRHKRVEEKKQQKEEQR